jgi:excinuclease ABC subunit A
MSERICIRGARQHNLKDLDVDLPRNKLIVITGLSGSGKSSLAFDTLYAEGQRRYVESLSTYARQFLERMEKPDVDNIEGLSPAIAIEQKTASHNPRSTVGTVTEIYDFLRLLYARVGQPHCHQCGRPIGSQTIDQMVDRLTAEPEGTRVVIMAPVDVGRAGSDAKLINRLKRNGFARVRINGDIREIETVGPLDKSKPASIEVVVDRLIIKPQVRKRLADSLELALAEGEGTVIAGLAGQTEIRFSEKSTCPKCNIGYPDFTPASFSFNSPRGACPACNGLGSITELDPELIIPNPDLSLRDGAVAIWAKRNSVHFIDFLDALSRHYQGDIYTPYRELPEQLKSALLHGSGVEPIAFFVEHGRRRIRYQKPFEGILPNLERRYRETDSYQVREEIKQFMNFRPCPECQGAKLNPASRAVKVGQLTISEVTALSIRQARDYFLTLDLSGQQAVIAGKILREIMDRLGFLIDVGLGYLALDRSSQSLAGGESQRIRLATQIGSKLTGVLYVLDEPSIGLHQRDNHRLIETLVRMRDLGNTVLVVEHDEGMIRAADYVVDMGPGAGAHGGQIVFAGSPSELELDAKSLTGQYLAGRKQISIPSRRRIGNQGKLRLMGARKNNLKNIDVEFPLGALICITGVSGSGKSTLIMDTLCPALMQKKRHASVTAGVYDHLEGFENISRVINIDQSPIGKTPRSNPGTYTGVFNHIRDLFAKTPESRMRGYKPGRFSFNVKGGRCEACQGDGVLKIEMHFLPDVYVSCDVCQSRRYNRETLEIRYKGRNIDEVLGMTVNQAREFFFRIGNIRDKLQTLADVGLGYLQIGQPATTLSGGEAQRVKLARELSKRGGGSTLYVLDEPTTGLHTDDIRRLLKVLNQLVDGGNTVLVIEHNLDVIKSADFIVDLGPDGGDEGGQVVGSGAPEDIAGIAGSFTGRYLGKVLKKSRSTA